MGQPSGGVMDCVKAVEVKARRPVTRLSMVILKVWLHMFRIEGKRREEG